MKTIKRVIALFSAACVLAACGVSDAASADQLRQIQDKGVIVIGTEGTYAPNSYHDEEGNLTGFDVEVGRLIARERGSAVRGEQLGFAVCRHGLRPRGHRHQ